MENNIHPEFGYTYEEDVKPTPVLIDVEAGTKSNMVCNVLHIPQERVDKYDDGMKPLVVDVIKTMLRQETSVGFKVGQQHILDYLQKNCSQQQILLMASSSVMFKAKQVAEDVIKKMSDLLESMLSQLLRPRDDEKDF